MTTLGEYRELIVDEGTVAVFDQKIAKYGKDELVFTVSQAYTILERLEFPRAYRTLFRAVEKIGFRMGISARRNPWLVTLTNLQRMLRERWGFMRLESDWQEAIATVMGEEDA